MAKRITVIFAAYALAAMLAAAQEAAPVSANAGARTDATSLKTTMKISGRISNDGKTFVDTEGVAWRLINSDAVAENVGEHVVLRGRIDAGKHEIEVSGVRIDNSAGARLHDVAFRK